MKNKYNFLSFKVYEYETFKFTIEWLIENSIEFSLKTKTNVVGIFTYKFKINFNELPIAKASMLVEYITKEEVYKIRFT